MAPLCSPVDLVVDRPRGRTLEGQGDERLFGGSKVLSERGRGDTERLRERFRSHLARPRVVPGLVGGGESLALAVGQLLPEGLLELAVAEDGSGVRLLTLAHQLGVRTFLEEVTDDGPGVPVGRDLGGDAALTVHAVDVTRESTLLAQEHGRTVVAHDELDQRSVVVSRNEVRGQRLPVGRKRQKLVGIDVHDAEELRELPTPAGDELLEHHPSAVPSRRPNERVLRVRERELDVGDQLGDGYPLLDCHRKPEASEQLECFQRRNTVSPGIPWSDTTGRVTPNALTGPA